MEPTSPPQPADLLAGRIVAGIDLLRSTGITEVELAYDDEGETFVGEGPRITWWCKGNWDGQRVYTEGHQDGADAIEALLRQVMTGGRCLRCQQPTLIGVVADGHCCFVLHAASLARPDSYRWVRSCQQGEADA